MTYKTMDEVLEETVEFYSKDPSNLRSILKKSGTCVYYGDAGQKCAFSRCCKEKSDLKEMTGVQPKYLKFLKDKYKKITSIMFWKDIQCFHDNDPYWSLNSKCGLSKAGLYEYNLIKNRIERKFYQ